MVCLLLDRPCSGFQTLQENGFALGNGRSSLSGQPLYIHLVGIENETAEHALSTLGDGGEKLILTSALEVGCFYAIIC